MSVMVDSGTPTIPPAVRQPVGPRVEELAITCSPWDAALRFADLPHLAFFDSAEMAGGLGRYSFIAADPAGWQAMRVGGEPAPSFDHLRRLLQRQRAEPVGVPFPGGIAGVCGYELGRVIERIPRARFDEFELPDLAFGHYDTVIGWDHLERRSWIVSQRPGRIPSFIRRLRAPSPVPRLFPGGHVVPAVARVGPRRGLRSSMTRSEFVGSVARAVEYIHAGDCFQVNLAQRLLAPFHGHPVGLYARLRDRNPAPFGGYFDLGPAAVLSSSPELFLRVDPSGTALTRPIKGTGKRASDPVMDEVVRRELAASPKDRAENVMIVDLLRNDLGKVCRFGSIRVDSVCEPETFRTVHHLTSQVSGRLRPGLTSVDLLQACFPGGSITGAPKVRAMEIIAELEPVARGPYCGSMFWLGADGSMDSNILIRTIVAGRGWAQLAVGAGIVADSIPELEYEETLAKAEGLIAAL